VWRLKAPFPPFLLAQPVSSSLSTQVHLLSFSFSFSSSRGRPPAKLGPNPVRSPTFPPTDPILLFLSFLFFSFSRGPAASDPSAFPAQQAPAAHLHSPPHSLPLADRWVPPVSFTTYLRPPHPSPWSPPTDSPRRHLPLLHPFPSPPSAAFNALTHSHAPPHLFLSRTASSSSPPSIHGRTTELLTADLAHHLRRPLHFPFRPIKGARASASPRTLSLPLSLMRSAGPTWRPEHRPPAGAPPPRSLSPPHLPPSQVPR
jgi:hypothetical protein